MSITYRDGIFFCSHFHNLYILCVCACVWPRSLWWCLPSNTLLHLLRFGSSIYPIKRTWIICGDVGAYSTPYHSGISRRRHNYAYTPPDKSRKLIGVIKETKDEWLMDLQIWARILAKSSNIVWDIMLPPDKGQRRWLATSLPLGRRVSGWNRGKA